MNKKFLGIVFGVALVLISTIFVRSFADAATSTITSFTPASGDVGDTVTINGTNFDSFTEVLFGSIPSLNSSFVSSTQLTAEVPTGLTPGDVKITIKTTEAGDPISNNSFKVLASNASTSIATISSFSPLEGKVKDLITVKGTNLNNITSILIGDNDTKAIAKTSNSGEVTFEVPSGAVSGKIKIVTSSNGTAESSIDFGILSSSGASTASNQNITASNITSSGADLAIKIDIVELPYVGNVVNEADTNDKGNQSLSFASGNGSDTVANIKVTGLNPATTYTVNLTGNYSKKTEKITFKTLGVDASFSASGSFLSFPGGIVPKCNVGEIDKVSGQYKVPCDFGYAMLLVNNVIKFLLFIIATPLMALILVYMAWLMISAGGNSEQVTKVKHILFNAVVGYVIALAAWLIINTIVSSLKVDPEINTFMEKIDKNY